MQKQDWHVAKSPEHMDEPAQAAAAKAGEKPGKPPITANPAFPWIVALWFAALLGVGSLIVPVALLERASTASGLASLLPMAAPPLGFTAQSLVALAGTLVGGMLGFVLAKKIAAPRAAKASDRKVLSAPDDIGDFGIEGDDHDDLPAPAGRRRALAIEQEEGPSDFLNVAPVPAVREPKASPVMGDVVDDVVPDEEHVVEADDQPAADEPRQEFQPDEEPRQVFQPAPVEPEVEDEDEDEPFELDAAAAIEAEVDAGLTGEQPVHEQDLPQPGFERQEFIAVANATGPVVDVHYAEPVEAAATAEEPLAFSPPSMAREDRDEDHDEDIGDEQHFVAEPTFAPHDNAGPESEETVSDKQIFEPADGPVEATSEMPVDETVVEEVAVDAAAIDAGEQGEGLVQLVQRLGSTLDKHREWAAEKAAEQAMLAQAEAEAEAAAKARAEAQAAAEEEAAAVAEAEAIAAAEAEAAAEEEAALEAPVPDEFDPAAAEDAAQAMAAYFGSPAAQPASETEAETGTEQTIEAPAFDKPADTGEEPRQRYGAFTGTIAAVDLGDEDEDEDEDAEIADLAATFTLPRLPVSEPEPEPRPAFDQPPAAAEDETVAQDEVEEIEEVAQDSAHQGHADVADFPATNPFKRNAEEFVRIEEPEPDADNAEPAVLFPNQASRKSPAGAARAFDPPASEAEAAPQRSERPQPSNDDNERALREALLNLQRMGK